MSGASADIVLVAGGSGAVGGAVAARFAAGGARVLVHGRTQTSADAAAARIGGSAVGFGADLRSLAETRALFDLIARTYGRLSAVVDCSVTAPPGITGRFADCDPAQFPALCHDALLPILNLCHGALPLLRHNGGGAIVAFASDAGRVASAGQSLIGATRAAVMQFVRALSLEVADAGIRVHCLSPSYIAGTPVFDHVMARGAGNSAERAARKAGLGLPRADDIAPLVTFLASADAAHLTGQVISVNGGLTAV